SVRCFQLERIQRGKHDKRLIQLVGLAPDSHRLLLHCLEQGGLSLRCCPVDFVSEDHVRKDWTWLKVEVLLARFTLPYHVGAENVGGHQIGSELDSRGLQMQGVAQRLHKLRFAQSRNTFENDVASREDCHEDIVDDAAVTDDDLGDLSAHAVEFALKRVEMFAIQLGGHMVRNYTA